MKSADFASGDTDRPRPPPGDRIESNLFDALAHTCDIATSANVAIECSDVLWSAGLVAVHAVIDPDRDLRQFGTEIVVRSPTSPKQRFPANLGRSELWHPA